MNSSRRVAPQVSLATICWILGVSTIGIAVSAEGAPAWEPAPPMPDDWDWIRLNSGEWLKGEIIAMYDDSLEFDSDELDLLTLDWGDIAEVRSGQIMKVRFLGEVITTGKLLVTKDTVRVLGEQDQQFERSLLLTITGGAPREIDHWSAKATLGANIRQGNTDQTEANARLQLLRRTVKNRHAFDYIGNYTMTEDVETTNNHRANFVWDKFVTDRFFVNPIFAEWFRDPFQNIASRATVGFGVGYQLIDTSRTDWSVSAGPAYQRTVFDQVAAGEDDTDDTPALSVSTVFDTELTSWVDFNWQYRFQLTNEKSGTYNHHMVTTFETELTKRIDFDVSLVWDRIQDPQPDADGVVPLQDDLRTVLGLGWDF